MQVKYTGVGVEPVTLADVKTYMKVDFTDEDDLITALITGAREKIEEFTGLALVIKTITAFYESCEVVDNDRELLLPYPSHDAITELKINGVVSTDYSKTGLSQFIVRVPSVISSISTETVDDQGVLITYTTTGECPEAVKTEIKRLISQQYEQRGNTFEGAIVELSENAYSNLMQFSIV